MKDFIDDDCDPPENWKIFDIWANKPAPTEEDYKGPFLQRLQRLIPDLVFDPIFIARGGPGAYLDALYRFQAMVRNFVGRMNSIPVVTTRVTWL